MSRSNSTLVMLNGVAGTEEHCRNRHRNIRRGGHRPLGHGARCVPALPCNFARIYRYSESAKLLLRKTGASLTQTTSKTDVRQFEASSEDARPSCGRAVFSAKRYVQNLHVRRLHESTNEPAENKQRRHSVAVERGSWRSSTGESVLADIASGVFSSPRRHVGSPLGYAPGNLSPLTRIRATYGASQQPRAATPGIPFDNQCSDRTGAHLTTTPL